MNKEEEFTIIGDYIKDDEGEFYNLRKIDRFYVDEATTAGFVVEGFGIYVTIGQDHYQIKKGYDSPQDALKAIERLVRKIDRPVDSETERWLKATGNPDNNPNIERF